MIDQEATSESGAKRDLWVCFYGNRSGEIVASLGAFDLGRFGTTEYDPCRRVVEAELAKEVLAL